MIEKPEPEKKILYNSFAEKDEEDCDSEDERLVAVQITGLSNQKNMEK